MSTIAPTAARAIGERLADDGIDFLEAPVSGSRPKAEDGTLTIMVGGERSDFERARPLFEAMGERIVHVGPRGHAQLAKLLTNTMGAVNAAALAEAVLAVARAGIDPDAFLEVAAGSAGQLDRARPEGPADVRARLRPALQARAHAQGRAPLPRRGARAGRGAAPRDRSRSRYMRRPPTPATERRTSRP